MNQIELFCKARLLPKHLEDMFTMYLRSIYAKKFDINQRGDTIKFILSKITDEEVEKIWLDFVIELGKTLSAH